MLKSAKRPRKKSHFRSQTPRRNKRLYPKLPKKRKNQKKLKSSQDWRDLPIFQLMLSEETSS